METSGNKWSHNCKTFKRGTTNNGMLDSKEKIVIRVERTKLGCSQKWELKRESGMII